MVVDQISLPRQLDIVFTMLAEELKHLSSGTVFVQIRNNNIGKFGIKHDPIPGAEGRLEREGQGLTSEQLYAFRKMAIQSLKYKKNWTHGEICFDFAIKKNLLVTSVQFESNYNMANHLPLKSR
jgi:hypothetical protein